MLANCPFTHRSHFGSRYHIVACNSQPLYLSQYFCCSQPVAFQSLDWSGTGDALANALTTWTGAPGLPIIRHSRSTPIKVVLSVFPGIPGGLDADSKFVETRETGGGVCFFRFSHWLMRFAQYLGSGCTSMRSPQIWQNKLHRMSLAISWLPWESHPLTNDLYSYARRKVSTQQASSTVKGTTS